MTRRFDLRRFALVVLIVLALVAAALLATTLAVTSAGYAVPAALAVVAAVGPDKWAW